MTHTDFGLSLNIIWYLWMASLVFSAISVAQLLNQIPCGCGCMCSTGFLNVADDLEARFYFSLCILDQQILLVSTFFVKLVLLYLHRLFEFSSTETKMKTFCLEQNQCQIFLLGCLLVVRTSSYGIAQSSDVCLLLYWHIFLFPFPSSFPQRTLKLYPLGFFRSVGTFLDTHCDGFFLQASPRRGIPPLSIYCLVIRQGFLDWPPVFWLPPSLFAVSTAARSWLH